MSDLTTDTAFSRLESRMGSIRALLEETTVAPRRYGKVASVIGMLIECTGLEARVGELYQIEDVSGNDIQAEVVGLREERALLMPYQPVNGLRIGCRVTRTGQTHSIPVGEEMLGRVVNEEGVPIDGKTGIFCCKRARIHRDPPSPFDRLPIKEPFRTGIRSLDALNSMGRGQRIGLFAGSGVGKSVLMGMIAQNSSAEVNVIALIGERGREVQEFIQETLSEEGAARSVVVSVTSDQAAMSRIRGAYTATAIAEYFRDQGKDVLLMMDSVTRVAMAQREIGLASGEPPTTKGYTPSVFAMLPKLLERPGRTDKGSMTAIYTVLVDQDDMNEPIADAVRSILDGHIVLSRRLAHRNHFPAVDVLESVSRVMPKVVTEKQRRLSMRARELLAAYREAEELIQIGAYVQGSSKKVDLSIRKMPELESFLIQDMSEESSLDFWQKLESILGTEENRPDPGQSSPTAGTSQKSTKE
ncbi:MAG: FliI/YscN family ATPase [Balneolaceae bacterium]